MTNLHDIAEDMLLNGIEYSKQAAASEQDFLTTFVMYRVISDGEVSLMPMPMPHYTRDREFHRALMRAALERMQAHGFVFVMEAWMASDPLGVDPGAPGFVPPSERPDRQECIMVHGMSREGGEVCLVSKITRKGKKTKYSKIEDWTNGPGKGIVAAMGPMFGERVN